MQISSNEPSFLPSIGQAGGAPAAPGLREADLARAEVRGKQVLLYAPDGPLGGSFGCTRCAATALQPDLLDHQVGCPYRQPAPVTRGSPE